MTKMLTDLLKAKDPLFSNAIDQLEQASGQQGQDVKLTAEIIEKFNDRVKKLGLDPTDSTGKEIYNALINLIKEHDKHLAKQIGATDPDDIEKVVPLALKAIEKQDIPLSCWVLKKSVAKRFLKDTPPPNVMKRLRYTSVDSMLKKENIFEIYGALRFAETDDWLDEFNKKYKTLKPSDFVTRKIEIVRMPKERWSDIAAHFVDKKRHFHTHLKEMGIVIVMPATIEKMPGITTKIMTLTLHYINEIRLYSAFFKTQQVKKNFGEIFVNTLLADPSDAAVLAGSHIHWRVIQRYFGKLPKEYHPEIFEPHVQPEDLHWRKAEDIIYQIDPELEFWRDLDYVGKMYDGSPLTMNFMDISLGYSNNISYEEDYIYHFREALWNEIFARYMGMGTLEEQILKQLDNDLIEPEVIGPHHF